MMPKFYIESGNFKLISHARDARSAAIWAVHRAMSQMLPFLASDNGPTSDNGESSEAAEPVVLGELIRTSEQGFGRSDGALHDTFDVTSEWHRLIGALDRLLDATSSEATAV